MNVQHNREFTVWVRLFRADVRQVTWGAAVWCCVSC